MSTQFRNRSYGLAASGLALQAVGWLLSSSLVGLAGSVLLCVGLCYYAKSKGRHVLWGVLGFFSLIGLAVLVVLPDKSGPPMLSRS
jgi:hypothetical protein